MALLESPLSIIAKAIAGQVRGKLKLGEKVEVEIGSPAALAPAPTDSDHRLSLFFYRCEPAVGVPHQGPGEPLWLRVHCIITAFSSPGDKGEMGLNELRLLGEVLRIFHAWPCLAIDLSAVAGAGQEPRTVAVEMIPAPLTLDDINRLWSTQRDVAYRPSIAYEVTLVPVLPTTPSAPAPPVQRVLAEVEPILEPAGGGNQ